MNKNSKNGIEPKKNGNYISHINTFRAFPRILTAAPGRQLWGTIPGLHWPLWNTARWEVGGHLPEKVSSWEVDLRFGTGSEIFGDLSKIHDICVAWDQRLWDFFCVQLRDLFFPGIEWACAILSVSLPFGPNLQPLKTCFYRRLTHHQPH